MKLYVLLELLINRWFVTNEASVIGAPNSKLRDLQRFMKSVTPKEVEAESKRQLSECRDYRQTVTKLTVTERAELLKHQWKACMNRATCKREYLDRWYYKNEELVLSFERNYEN